MFSFHCGVFTYPSSSSGPNELSIRDASLIHPVLGQGGLPKGPRASMFFIFVRRLYLMIRLGWGQIINWHAGSSKTLASPQVLESGIFIDGYKGVRIYRGKPCQTTCQLSRKLSARIDSRGGRFVGYRSMAELFYVRADHHHRAKLISDL
jgi:hypothetical protein